MTDHDEQPGDVQPGGKHDEHDEHEDPRMPEALAEAYGKVGRVEVGEAIQEQQRRIAEKFAGLIPKLDVFDAKRIGTSVGPLNPPVRSAYDVLRDMPEIEVVPSASAENQHRQNELLEEVLDLTRRGVELAEADRATSEQLNASTQRMVAAQESASGLTWKVFWATTAVAVTIAIATTVVAILIAS